MIHRPMPAPNRKKISEESTTIVKSASAVVLYGSKEIPLYNEIAIAQTHIAFTIPQPHNTQLSREDAEDQIVIHNLIAGASSE